jgi:hypothetical protein
VHYDPQEDLAKFGWRSERKVDFFSNPAIPQKRSYGLNMTNSTFLSLKYGHSGHCFLVIKWGKFTTRKNPG